MKKMIIMLTLATVLFTGGCGNCGKEKVSENLEVENIETETILWENVEIESFD